MYTRVNAMLNAAFFNTASSLKYMGKIVIDGKKSK